MVELDGPFRHAVHRLKYRDRPGLGPALAAAALQAAPDPPQGMIAPVPLHPRRQRLRGYNQAELLGRAVARELGRTMVFGLARAVDTRPQVDRDGGARREALRDAFRWVGPGFPPAEVVVVDDVVTTGATLLDACRAMRRAGSIVVHGLALGRG